MKKSKKNIKLTKKTIAKTRITKKMIFKALLCFAIIFGILNFTKHMVLQNQINNKKKTAAYVSTIAFDQVSVDMQIIETKIKSIIDFSIDSKGNIADFERIATTKVGNDYVSCVALAPDGIIQYTYPIIGNEFLVGYDLHNGSIDVNNIDAPINNNQDKSAIYGPYLFQNGKTYLIIKVPVLLHNGNPTAKLWGYACAFIDFPKSLTENGFHSLIEQKYNYKLYRNDINNKEKIILSSHDKDIEQGIIIQRVIFNETWNVLIEPNNGWYNKNRYCLESIITLIISILISIVIFDYLRLKETGKILTRFVNIDMLTGVFSRKYFYDYVEAEIRRNKRFGVCYIDVDNFKEVNDHYGHEIGDILLLEIGKRIQECIRNNDFVSRIGGDEFVIFINDIEDEFAGELILKRIRNAMDKPFEFKNIILQNSLSVGYSLFPKDGSNIEELIHNADRYMYKMKLKNHRDIHIKHMIKHSKMNHVKIND